METLGMGDPSSAAAQGEQASEPHATTPMGTSSPDRAETSRHPGTAPVS